MDDNILKTAEDLYFHHTNANVESSERIPHFTTNIILSKRFFIDDTEYKVGYIDQETDIEDKRLAMLTNNIRFCPQRRTALSERFSRNIIKGNMTDLVDRHIIHPFMLFIRGRFVKWSDIKIYKDSRYCFIVIENAADDTLINADIQILQLPIDNIIYDEDNLQLEDLTLIFAFDEDGKYEVSGFTRFYMDPKSTNIGYIQLRLPSSSIYEDDVQVPDESKLYPSNFIFFKDGELYFPKTVSVSMYNTLTVDNGETGGLEYKMFYDKSSNIPYNNVSKIINHQYLKHTYLNTDPNPKWLDTLHEGFDFVFDATKSYDDNISDFWAYAKKYNYREFIDRLKSDNVIRISGYVEDISPDIKENVLFIFPRLFNRSGVGYMMYVNGIMCNNRVKEERSYGVVFDMTAFPDGSVYEFIAYNNKADSECSTVLYEELGPDFEYFTGWYYDGGDFDLMCSAHPDAIFKMDDKSVLYKIDPSQYTVTDKGIKFSDFYNTLSGVQVYRVPTAMFAYNKFVIDKTEDFNVHLSPEKFRFCHDHNKYMVFVNGTRVQSNLYRVIVPHPTVPFNDHAIYFSIVLHKDDVVEVFYTPMSILDEVYIDNLNHSSETGSGIDQLGYIKAPTKLGMPLSIELHSFFVNGIKIPYDFLMDVSYDLARIVVNMQTIEDLCIIGFDSDLINLVRSLDLDKSNLDEVFDAHDKSGINILTNTFTTVTNVKDRREKTIEDHALINEIVRYYYGPVNKGIPFTYAYDKSVYAEVDSAGNINIDVMDATKRTNLKLNE